MKKILLLAATAALFSFNAQAQDTSTGTSSADTWVIQGSKTSYGKNNTIEIRTDTKKPQYFYGLMAFSFTKPNDGNTVTKATLRLTTRYKKGDSAVELYDLNAAFAENCTYDDVADAISTALNKEPATTFKLNSYNQWAPTDKQVIADFSTVDKWQSNVDITALVKAHASEGVVYLLFKKKMDQDNSSQIYTKEATDVTNSTLNFTFTAADLVPQLTVTYGPDSGINNSETSNATTQKDTWIMNSSSADRSSDKTMEICTYEKGNKYLYGLMSFALPGSNYTITSAKLRLTTERVKGKSGMNIYGFDNDFEESTDYSKVSDAVTTALGNTITSFTVNNGIWNKAVGTDDIAADYSDVSKWQTTVDLTDYANSLGDTQMNLMLGKNADENSSTKFFTKEQGDLTVKLSDGTTTTWAAADLQPQLTLVYALASHTLTVTDAGAATLVLPYEATIPEGVKAYTLTYTSGDAATATELSGTIPANTPVLINAEAGSYTFNATETQTTKATSPVSGALTGVWAESTVPEGSYVLQNLNGTVAFYKVSSSDIKCPANCAYLTTSASAKALSINFGGSTTGINSVAANKANGEVYNLQGVRMKGSLKKGLYIQNGKKFVVK